ncbi:MAG: hypothetical protein AAGA55_02120 [Planctomycetota bacterium]
MSEKPPSITFTPNQALVFGVLGIAAATGTGSGINRFIAPTPPPIDRTALVAEISAGIKPEIDAAIRALEARLEQAIDDTVGADVQDLRKQLAELYRSQIETDRMSSSASTLAGQAAADYTRLENKLLRLQMEVDERFRDFPRAPWLEGMP